MSGGWVLLGGIAQALGFAAAAYIAATYGLRQWGIQERNRDLDRLVARLDRTIDVLTAIEAEVSLEADAPSAYFSGQTSDALRAAPLERIKIMSGRMMFSLDDIRNEDGHVPERCIVDVVDFYKNNARLEMLSSEITSGGFARYEGEEQRRRIVGSLVDLGERTLACARKALCSVDAAKAELRAERLRTLSRRRFD